MTNLTKQFYHVSRAGKLEGEITLSKDFSSLVIEKPNTFFNNNELIKTIEDYFPNGISRHGENYLSHKIFYWHDDVTNKDFIPYIPSIELVFEIIRIAKYPTLPSRFQSMFAFEKLEDALNFKSLYSKEDCPIYIVEANKYIKRDMNLLKIGFNISGGITLAEKYWSAQQSETPEWEILLELPVKIIKCLS